jgi:hypothetical protein
MEPYCLLLCSQDDDNNDYDDNVIHLLKCLTTANCHVGFEVVTAVVMKSCLLGYKFQQTIEHSIPEDRILQPKAKYRPMLEKGKYINTADVNKEQKMGWQWQQQQRGGGGNLLIRSVPQTQNVTSDIDHDRSFLATE